MKAFSQRLKTVRKTAGLTLKQLAAQIEVSEAYVSMLESGKRQPARSLVLQIATALGGGPDSALRDELLILAGYSPENLTRFEAPRDPLSSYQQELLSSPEDFSLFQGYVQTLIKTGRMAEALTQVEQGFKRFQDAYQLQCLIADLELARHHPEAALLAQQSALEQFELSASTDTYLKSLLVANLGGICFQLGMQRLGSGERLEAQAFFLKAESHFGIALELDPANLFSLDEYARVCFNLADLETGAKAQHWWNQSLAAFASVMAADPKPGLSEAAIRESAVFWAYAQAKCGHFSQARQQLWTMSSFAPQDWLPRYMLASVWLLEYRQSQDQTQLEAAAVCFARSLTINPEQALATGLQDPDLELLRELHPALFQTPPHLTKEP